MFMLVMGIANPGLKAQTIANSVANHLTKGLSQQ
jgi:ribosomal protein S3